MSANPWTLLCTIGWIALALGVLSAFRLFPLDWPGIGTSLWCGWALLKRRPSALLATSIAGGIVLADAFISIILLGPVLLHELGREEGDWHVSLLPFLIPQVLLYGVQAVFWPWAAATVLRNQTDRGIAGAYSVHTRDTVVGAFCVSAWISLVFQMWAKTVIFRIL